jgi:hypothetical protein
MLSEVPAGFAQLFVQTFEQYCLLQLLFTPNEMTLTPGTLSKSI